MPKYYSITRPIVLNAEPPYPCAAQQFAERRYIPEIDCMAWGWVEYEEELTPQEIADHELVREPREDG